MKKRIYEPLEIALWMLKYCKKHVEDEVFIGHMKLQKLLYYAQAWHLAFYDKPLFNGRIEAWAHGPVVIEVWHELKGKTFHRHEALNPEIIPSAISDEAVARNEEAVDLLNQIMTIYGEKSAKFLEDLSHSEEPWIEARGNTPDAQRCNELIKHSTMKQYYRKLHEQLKSKQ